MNIQANNLYAELQGLAQQASGQAIQANPLDINPMAQTEKVQNPSSASFGNLLKQAIDNVNDLQQTSKELKTAVEMGDRNVSLAEAMIASQKAGIAFEATVQVRNQMVEAYKNIMSMPV